MAGVAVSVVLPVYNGEKTLEFTLASILAQTFRDVEVVVVDDGSSDASPAIVERFRSDSRVRAFRKENGGVASARNHGIARAAGDLIAFCDQDDVWLPDKLTRQVPLFGDPRVGLVYGWVDYYHRSPEGDLKRRGSGRRPRHSGDCVAEIFSRNFLTSCTVVVRKALVESVGMLDEDRVLHGVDDWHLWLRLAPRTRFAVVESVVAQYVTHAENYSRNERAMLEAELACLRRVRPGALEDGISPRSLDSAEAASHTHYARNLFFLGDYRESARCWWRGWRLRPAAVHWLIAAALLRMLPKSWVDGCRSVARRIRRKP